MRHGLLFEDAIKGNMGIDLNPNQSLHQVVLLGHSPCGAQGPALVETFSYEPDLKPLAQQIHAQPCRQVNGGLLGGKGRIEVGVSSSAEVKHKIDGAGGRQLKLPDVKLLQAG